jgi:hypothetical protein
MLLLLVVWSGWRTWPADNMCCCCSLVLTPAGQPLRQVEVLDAESHQPLSRYLMLVDAPVQLSMAAPTAAQTLPGAVLMPPSLSAIPPAGWEQSAEGVTMPAASTGNCSFELLGV